MILQRHSNRQSITIDFLLGTGGEARIYALSGEPSLVAKIYHKPSAEKSRKLSIMLANPPDDPMSVHRLASIAWPVDLLITTTNTKQVIGFLMPRMTGMRSLISFYNPGIRRRQNPLFNYRYLHRAAGNLSAAVNALHVMNYVIGDINESNILVSDTALVSLVDTDSFQVRDPQSGEIYRCPVGKPEFTPPELQGRLFLDTDRSPEHDRFGLAVLIFQILMEGIHPYAGIFLGSGDPPPYEERIAAGHFPYSNQKTPYIPSKTALSFETLHPELRKLFILCFDEGNKDPSLRPDAKTWQNALNNAEKDLVACPINSQHLYGSHLKVCPWCERAKQLKGRDSFPSLEIIRSGQHIIPEISRSIPVHRNPSIISHRSAGTPRRSMINSMVRRSGLQTRTPAWVKYVFVSIFVLMIISLGFSSSRFIKAFFAGGQSQKVLKGHSGPVNTIAFSPDGTTLASGSSDKTIKVWKLESGDLIYSLEGHDLGVFSMAYSPDGKTIFSFGFDNKLIFWDADTGRLRRVIKDQKKVFAVAFSKDGRIAAYGNEEGNIQIIDIRNGKLLRILEGFSNPVNAIVFSDDSKIMAAGSMDYMIGDASQTLKLWKLDTWELLYSLETSKQLISSYQGVVRSLAFSPNGGIIANGSVDNVIRLWNLKTGELEKVLSEESRRRRIGVLSIAFSRDGKFIAAGSDNNMVRIWDVRTRYLRAMLRGHKNWVSAIAFSPDGNILASGSRDNTVRIWNMGS